ncbi:GntR family transcriptional regulator [Agromyces sp. SYSU T00194]|uniref:GntR family transcriptional regulator n=1 Tax=Agromyces chitinivorans TaxID=3158560 RepID=UPI003391CD2D
MSNPAPQQYGRLVPLPPIDDAGHPRSVRGARAGRRDSAFQVHSTLRAFIRTGVIRTGQVLREEDLIKPLGANRGAVREALQLLVDEGLIVRRRRSGTVVVRSVEEVPMDQILVDPSRADDPRYSVRRLGGRTLDDNIDLAQQLEAADGRVRLTEWLVEVDGRPACARTSFVAEGPAADRFVEYVADLPTTFRHVFREEFGGLEATIEAVALEPRMASLLAVPVGSPALMRELVLKDVDGRIREISYTLYRGDTFAVRTATSAADAPEPTPFSDLGGTPGSEP